MKMATRDVHRTTAPLINLPTNSRPQIVDPTGYEVEDEEVILSGAAVFRAKSSLRLPVMIEIGIKGMWSRRESL